jgi:hypothetical protein
MIYNKVPNIAGGISLSYSLGRGANGASGAHAYALGPPIPRRPWCIRMKLRGDPTHSQNLHGCLFCIPASDRREAAMVTAIREAVIVAIYRKQHLARLQVCTRTDKGSKGSSSSTRYWTTTRSRSVTNNNLLPSHNARKIIPISQCIIYNTDKCGSACCCDPFDGPSPSE